MGDLKPCPWCGDTGAETAQSAVWGAHGEKFAVYCNTCFAEGPPKYSIDEAAEAWNLRTHPQPVTPAGGEVVRGEATGDTATFKDAWARLSPIDRSVISIYFQETHPPVADAALVAALKRVVTVLGPVVPASVTDEGARWEWRDALETAVAALNQRGGG